MKLFLAVASAAMIVSLAQAQTAYVDVPSCHWAVEAINQVSAGDKPTPAQSAGNAQNAVRQVFEGLQCGDPAWTQQFIVGAPSSLEALVKSKPIRGFALNFGLTVVNGRAATILVDISLTLPSGIQKRSATLTLSSDAKAAWRVNYASLAALSIAVFPK